MTLPTASTPAPPDGNSLDWVTWLRVIAIFGVVSIHNSAPNASHPRARESTVGNVAIALDLPFIFAVPLFIMLSGALLLDPDRFTTTGEFLRKRALRIVPALVFWNLFYIVLNGILDGWPGPVEVVRRLVTGQVAVHLYFFWIVLGLTLLTPALVRWVGATGRREWLAGGLLAVSVPVLTAMTTVLREQPLTFVHTAWTWWVPYLGVFILGWALRGVLLGGVWLVAAVLLVMGLIVLVAWQWRNPAAPDWLQTAAPVNYYGPTTTLLAVLIFLAAQAALSRDGILAPLVSRRLMRVVGPVGGATLGIFGLHLGVLQLFIEWNWFGPGPSPTPFHLIARYVAAMLVTIAVVIPLRNVPYVRALL